MSWPKKPLIFNLCLGAIAAALTGCGVKGDPLPPEKPVEMGRGRPTYRRATEKIDLDQKDEGEDDQAH